MHKDPARPEITAPPRLYKGEEIDQNQTPKVPKIDCKMPDSQQDTNGNKSSQKQSGNAKSAKSGTHLQEHDRELKELIHAARDSEAQAIMLADLEKAARKSADGRAYEEATTAHFQLSIMQQLSDCIFVGHINTDLDSVAGAIGAACLFGGTPAISEENLNGEILFALKTCGIETPQLFDSIHGSQSGPQSKPICLVDHSEEKQMVASLRNCPDRGVRIQGIIDHHAVAASFTTGIPVFVDMRPWGSMSSIIAILFITYKKHLPKPLAKLLLMAILSDTLDLRSVTTTDADCEIVTLLCRYAGVGDHDALASEQFQAKTDWIVNLGAYEMTRGDQKDFTAGDWKFGIAVLEVTTPDPVLKIAAQIMCELRLLKKEKGNTNYKESKLRKKSQELDFAFLFVVDIINQDSKMIICGGRELALAKAAFPKGSLQEAVQGIKPVGNTIAADETCMYLPGMVSRKKQFAPAFHAALNDAFECSKGPNATTEKDSLVRDTVSTLSGPVAAQSVQLQRSQQLRRTLKEISPAQLQEEKLLAAESLTVDTYHDSVRVHGRPYEKDAKKKDLRATLKALPQINEIHNYSNSSSTLSKSG